MAKATVRKKLRDNKVEVLARLRRVQGQAGALVRMVEEDAYCTDVLTQIAAVRAALLAAGKEILKEHMRSCVTASFAGGRSAEAIAEIETVLMQFVK